jgi:tetratricopeptide (TPR) repeat protein
VLSLMALITVVYAVTMTVVFSKKLAAEERARKSQQAASVGDFLTALLSEVGTWPNSREAKLVDALRYVDTFISSKVTGEPDAEAVLRLQVGKAFRSFGLFELSEQQMRLAATVREREFGAEAESTLEARTALALLLNNAEKVDEAESILREVLASHQRARPPDDPHIVWKKMYLADVLEKKRNLAEASELYRQAVASFTRNPGDRHERYYHAANNYLVFLTNQGRIAEAEPLARTAVKLLTEHMGEEDQRTYHMKSNLGRVLFQLGRPLEAEPIHRHLLEDHRARHGEKSHGSLIMHMVNLAETLRVLHQLDESEALFREAVAIRERERGGDDRTTLIINSDLADVLLAKGALAEAETRAREIQAGVHRAFGDASGETHQASVLLGLVLSRSGGGAEAGRLLSEGLNGLKSVFGNNSPERIQALVSVAKLEVERDDDENAEAHFREALDASDGVLPADHWLVAVTRGGVGGCLLRRGILSEAETELLASAADLQARLGTNHPESEAVLSDLAALYAASGRPNDETRVRAMLSREAE